MVLVAESAQELEYAIDIAIVDVFAIRHKVRHIADDLDRPEDVPVLFHQNACGSHGGLLSSLLILQLAFLHFAL
jgi:hypothetical protein